MVATIPKVVGGYTPACLEKAITVYSKAIKTLVPVSSCRVAEATKLPNVDDERESPSYVLMDLLAQRGASIAYHDPYVPVIKLTREHPHFAGTESIVWDPATIEGFDAVLIATNHASVNYRELADWAQCIVDTRNAMAGFATKAGQVWKA